MASMGSKPADEKDSRDVHFGVVGCGEWKLGDQSLLYAKGVDGAFYGVWFWATYPFRVIQSKAVSYLDITLVFGSILQPCG